MNLPRSLKLVFSRLAPIRKLNSLLVSRHKSHLDLTKERRALLRWIDAEYDVDAEEFVKEYEESGLGRWLSSARTQAHDVPLARGSTSQFDCETLYLIVRAARPDRVVETGVLHGAVSGHILAALEANGAGTLYSIDLEDLTCGDQKMRLVPPGLDHRWNLIIGDSRIVLPNLLEELGEIDLFFHDSYHTYEHMTWEYTKVLPWLCPAGLLCSHDVLTSSLYPNAFVDFAEANLLEWWVFRNVGVSRRSRRAP